MKPFRIKNVIYPVLLIVAILLFASMFIMKVPEEPQHTGTFVAIPFISEVQKVSNKNSSEKAFLPEYKFLREPVKKLKSNDYKVRKSGVNEFNTILSKKSLNEKLEILKKLLLLTDIETNLRFEILFINYKELDKDLRDQIKNYSTKYDDLTGEIATSLGRVYEYVPEPDRSQISFNLIQLGLGDEIILKKYDPKFLKTYFKTRKENVEGNLISPFIHFYHQMDKELSDLYFNEIIGFIQPQISYWEADLFFGFLLDNYLSLPKEYKQKIIFVAEKSPNISILEGIGKQKRELPITEKKEILNKIVNKLDAGSIVWVVGNDEKSSLGIILENYELLNQENKEKFLILVNKKEYLHRVISLILDNYYNYGKEVRELFEKYRLSNFIHSQTIAYGIARNYKKLPVKIQNIFEENCVAPKKSEIYANALSYNFSNFPVQLRNKLLIKLSGNKINDEGVIEAITDNYYKVPRNLKNIIFKFIEEERSLQYIFSGILKNYKVLPEPLKKSTFTIAQKLDAYDICSGVSYNLESVPSEIRNQLLKEVIKRSKTPREECDYENFEGYEEIIPKEIWDKLFSY